METQQPPQFTKAAISSAVRTVVDGFLDVYEFQNHYFLYLLSDMHGILSKFLSELMTRFLNVFAYFGVRVVETSY